MTIRKLTMVLLVAGLAGVGAYAAGVAARSTSAPAQPDSATEALLNWLCVPAEQRAEIQQHDPGFAADLKSLREAVGARRTELAGALDDPGASNETILGKLEGLLAANAAVERRVANYLLTVRHHLTPEQQRRLFGLCADGIRQGRNCANPPDGIGRGQGGTGRGRGAASGGHYRGGRGQD